MEAILSAGELALIALAVVVLSIVARDIACTRQNASERKWLPPELQNAELAYAERVFRARWPIPIVARLDRAYRNADGVIILVDLKTRGVNRTFFSDIIELSAQRLAVQAQTGQRVADYGFVLVKRVGAPTRICHRVKLLSTEEVNSLARRQRAILERKATAERARSTRFCSQCAFKRECKAADYRVTDRDEV